MLLKMAAVTALVLIVLMAIVISICSPELIQINLEYPHATTTATTSSEPFIISDPTTILILAAAFLIAAMFLGMLLVVVALRMR